MGLTAGDSLIQVLLPPAPHTGERRGTGSPNTQGVGRDSLIEVLLPPVPLRPAPPPRTPQRYVHKAAFTFLQPSRQFSCPDLFVVLRSDTAIKQLATRIFTREEERREKGGSDTAIKQPSNSDVHRRGREKGEGRQRYGRKAAFNIANHRR